MTDKRKQALARLTELGQEIDAIDLKAIRARLEAATLGPWDYCGTEWYGVQTEHAINWHAGNVDFVENAPIDIAALLAEVERLRAIPKMHKNKESPLKWHVPQEPDNAD